jgi:ketosteroid isomerase-like protein
MNNDLQKTGNASHELQDFRQFMERREEAARAYVSGDAAPLESMVARTSSATFFGPGGGDCRGPDEVLSRYRADASNFEPPGDTHFEVLQMAASDGIAYWVGFQRATAHLSGRGEAVPMNLRVTELFRREGDGWKLVHRHADFLVSEAQKDIR